MLSLPVVLAKERRRTGGRVVSAGGEAKESVVSLSGVEALIASVWWWANRLRRRRKRKPCEGEGEAMRRKPSRKGERPIDFLKCRIVIFFVFIFC